MSRQFSPGVSNFIAGILIGVLISAFGFAWVVRSGQSESGGVRPRVLRLGHGLPVEHPVHKAMAFMADRVKELSGGKLEIAIYPAGMIGSEAECLKQTQNGQLDLSKTSTAVLESSVPEMTAFSMPYLFRDKNHFWKVLDGPIGRKIAELPGGMRGLTYFDSGERSFYTTKKAIARPEDLKGMKIRTQQSRCAMDMVSALDGAPTPIPWGELYTALSQGTVDGAENNLPSFDTGRHLEVCKNFTLSEHSRVPDMLVIGTNTWDHLDPQQKAWLKEAAHEASLYQRKLWEEAEKESRKRSEEAGVRFLSVDKTAFAEKLRPLYDSQPEAVRKLVREIREVK